MSIHRVVPVVLATLFTAGISSAASANCCGWGAAAAPGDYAPVAYASAGCGGCGTPTAAVVYAQPVAPTLPPVAYGGWSGCGHCGGGLFSYAPVAYGGWSGCGHCGGGLYSYAPGVEAIAVAPAPIYVVNQGPDYTGPGIMTPFHTWTQPDSYVVPGSYPYFSGYGAYGAYHRYGYGHRYGFGARYGYGVRRGYIGPRRAVYRGAGWGGPMPMRRVYR